MAQHPMGLSERSGRLVRVRLSSRLSHSRMAQVIDTGRAHWISRHGDTSNVTGSELRQMAEEVLAWRHLNELHKVFDKRGVTPKPTFEEVFPHLKEGTTGASEPPLTDTELRKLRAIIPNIAG